MYGIAITYSIASLLLLVGFIYNLQSDHLKIVIILFAILSGRWQLRTYLMYLKQTDLLKNKDILMCLDVVAREYGGEVVDKN